MQLFIVQPLLLDNLPTMGVLPQIVQTFNSRKDSIIGSGLQVFNQVVGNEHCLRTLSANECMHPLKQAMTKRPDQVAIAADALSKIFTNQAVVDEFVGQVLKSIFKKFYNIFLIFNDDFFNFFSVPTL